MSRSSACRPPAGLDLDAGARRGTLSATREGHAFDGSHAWSQLAVLQFALHFKLETAQPNSTMARTPWLRIAGISLPPLLLTLWLSVPALQPGKQFVQGELRQAEACLIMCAKVAQIEESRLGCRIDLLGAPYDCPARLLRPGPVAATYVTFPSAAGLLGLAPLSGTLVKLESNGQVVYARSVSQLAWAAMYGGWLFHAIYWPIAGLIIWRRPNSKFSKRVTWSEDAQ